ncbi:MAG: hypothetical protein KAR20_03700, partial [Candidatus Heimdallarchaeota archaeon]|nr:hypothetical protein [Candidatus Heimdallarchaeota archaeon]
MKKRNVTIALDPSLTCTGIAIFDTAMKFADGTPRLIGVSSIETKDAKDKSRSEKLYYIAQELKKLKEEYTPSLVV